MSDESFFREVEEELRSDRMRNLWRKYGIYVIAAAVLVVLAVAASEGWRWWHDSNASRSSDLLYSALDLAQKGDIKGADAALIKTEQEGADGYPLLARFEQAGLLAKQGKNQDAAKAYDALASEASDRRVRELALVLGAYALVDKGDVDGVKTRVDGMIASGSPLAASAREALGLAQYKAGDLKAARKSFEAISNDPAASRDQVSRVQIYLSQLTSEGVGPAPTAADAAKAGGDSSGSAAAGETKTDAAASSGAAASDTKAGDTTAAPAAN